jgi:small-conductance mechanosensitive channel
MIEIVLRDDIRKYEPKPFFGMTGRQVASIAAAACVSVLLYLALALWLGLPQTLALWAVMAVGGAVAFAGLGTINGLKPEVWWELHRRERAMPAIAVYRFPHFEAVPGAKGKRRRLTRADRRALKAERSELEA